MNMESTKRRIRKHEGYSLIQYYVDGIPHIGIGHKLTWWESKKRCNKEWTPEQVRATFEKDFHQASDKFTTMKCCAHLNEVRRGICVEMVFWMGFRGFKKFKEMIKALDVKDYPLAALELYNSKIGKDPKLRKRARLLAEIMWEGQE